MRGASALGVLGAVAALIALLSAGAAPAAAADLRRLESVGVVGIRETGGRLDAPRDGAVRAAVARAVETVAQDLLPRDFAAGAADAPRLSASSGDLAPGLADVLGSDPFDYATRFRIVEDRGLRDALFSAAADVEQEYVVLVEVFVDVGRIRDRLHAAGWIDAASAANAGSRVRLVVEGLESFAAYDALRRTLLEDLDVRSALPLELTRGRAVLAVDGPYGVEALRDALVEQGRSGLRVVPLESDARSLTLLVDWAPPASRGDVSGADAARGRAGD